MTAVGVVGAGGRMGRRTIERLNDYQSLHLGAEIGRKTDVDDALSRCDMVLDWSAPPALNQVLPVAVARGLPYVVGSTALSDQEFGLLETHAKHIPILLAANFSVGVAVMRALVRRMGQLLGSDADYEIFEAHHRHKKDAPSGTAKAIGTSLLEAVPSLSEVDGRAGKTGARGMHEIGYSAIRGGTVAGEHTLFALLDGERIELTHRASSPMIFVDGALRACSWLVGKQPGLYSMEDVLEHIG